MILRMKNLQWIFFTATFMLLSACQTKDKNLIEQDTSITRYVDPFIGTGGHGHTYPGATVPFGMVQVSPDNGISGWDWCSGYHYSDSITIGFSHLHLSGTGIGDLNDIRIMPINKKVDLTKPVKSRNDIPYKSKYSHQNELSEPGYYQVYLNDHEINAELTSDLRTGFHKYTYKKNDIQSVIIDLGFAINWDKPVKTSLEIEDKFTVTGYRYSTGWAKNQKVYFVVKFSKSLEDYELIKDGTYINKGTQVQGEKTSVQLFFNRGYNNEIKVKVGVSSVSIENAKENISDHIGNFDFNRIRSLAKNNWNNQLSKITVETAIDSLKTKFYTALYHTQLAPVTFSDANNELRLSNDSIVTLSNATAYSTLSLWDTFRAEQPLLTILEPEKVTDIVKSMLLYYDEHKILPVWTLYANETNTMTGYHSIPVIVEAYLKGIRDFDIKKAYEAMKQTMLQDERGLLYYKNYGYIPFELLDESVTITLEYAYNDWCVAQMAKELGNIDDYEYFIKRSKAYQHLFDKKSGFMRGKSELGDRWHEPFDPKYSSHRVHADYTEGNAWQHSWFVLHDTEDLIKMHGGNNKFTQKLEQLFTTSSEITGDNISVDISGLIGQYAHGNEPSHHIAYMFNMAGKPWRTQYWVREILKTQYFASPDGLSGNEDCGQMSAWYVFSSIGLYPYNPVSGEYQIGSPLFDQSTIKISEEVEFVIRAENNSNENIYIQSATLNGEALNRTYITHQELLLGGTLLFQMGSEPNENWGYNLRD